MKIVHTITKLELGGAQQNTLFTLEHLPEGYTGFLICGKGGVLDKKALESERYTVKFCPFLIRKINPLYDFLAFIWQFCYFLYLKPDIVHSHSSKAGIISRWAAKIAGVQKIIHTFHGFGFTPLQSKPVFGLFVMLERVTAIITDKLIAVSSANIDKGLTLAIGKREQYVLIRSGVHFEDFKNKTKSAKIREQFPISGKQIIGNVSCFKPQKGLEVFIDCCRLLNEKGNYAYILVGDGVLRPKLEEQIKRSGLEDSFYMLGWRMDAAAIISEFDIMLHTAYFEGLPRVFLEAMAAGIPIVSSDVDGAKDVIENGQNGYLVSDHNRQELVERCFEVLENDELRIKMGKYAREKLGSEFSIEKMSEQLNELYVKIIGEKNG